MGEFLAHQVWNSELGRVLYRVGVILLMSKFSTEFSHLDSFYVRVQVLG